MLGLAIAAMFAATMSCLGGDYNACASVLTNDIYKRLLRPNASQREFVYAGRFMTLLIGAFGISTAFFLARASKAEGLFRMMVTLFDVATAPVAIPMLLGLISKRVTNRGAIAGFVLGTITGLVLFFLSRYKHEVAFVGFAWHPDTEDVVLAGFAMKAEMALFLSSAFVTLVAVFLFGGRADAEQLARIDAFAAKLDTPIGQLPEDVAAAKDKGAIMSPFRVVGVSLAVIACVMLAVVPWVDGTLAKGLDVGIGLLLVALGLTMAWRSRAPQNA
jgi:Na+/proline symporter